MNEHATDQVGTEQIRTAVLEILHEVIPTPNITLSMDTELFDGNLLDSFALIQLIVRLSEKFGIDIPPATFDRMEWSTLGAITAAIKKRIGQKSGTATV